MMGRARRTRVIGVASCLVLLVGAGPAAAQGPVIGATAPPTSDPADVRPCPVTVEQATAIAGMPMVPNPMYATPHGGMYVERTPRAPGLEDETTTYTCAYLSDATDGRKYLGPVVSLFLQYAMGDSAAWLWELNGPGIESDPSYVPLVDGDPAGNVYRQTTFFEENAEAQTEASWHVRDYLQADGLFADIIVTKAGDTQAVHDQVLAMASVMGLAIDEVATP